MSNHFGGEAGKGKPTAHKKMVHTVIVMQSIKKLFLIALLCTMHEVYDIFKQFNFFQNHYIGWMVVEGRGGGKKIMVFLKHLSKSFINQMGFLVQNHDKPKTIGIVHLFKKTCASVSRLLCTICIWHSV